MDIRRLRPEKAAVERFIEELWIPYHGDLGDAVEDHALVGPLARREDEDLLEGAVTFAKDQLESVECFLWIAVDGASDPYADLAEADGEFAGYVLGVVEASPEPFEWPDRFVIGDLFVREDHRGTGLADRLVDRAAEQAREEGCRELALDVDVDNERAIAFYEKRGFEPARMRMHLPTDAA